MIHTITLPGKQFTEVVLFPTEKSADARLMFGLLADRGHITITDFFEAARQIKQIEDAQMHEMEAIKLRWIRAGFCIEIHGNADRWQVTLLHSFSHLHRNPNGRGATLPDAFAAAEADLSEMLAAKGKLKV